MNKVFIFILIVFIVIYINGLVVSNANDLPICKMLFGLQISLEPQKF